MSYYYHHNKNETKHNLQRKKYRKCFESSWNDISTVLWSAYLPITDAHECSLSCSLHFRQQFRLTFLKHESSCTSLLVSLMNKLSEIHAIIKGGTQQLGLYFTVTCDTIKSLIQKKVLVQSYRVLLFISHFSLSSENVSIYI